MQSERGWDCSPCACSSHTDYAFQKRLERIERLKDDPYYIFDKKKLEKPITSTSSDIDSIPIVRLDDLMPVAPGPPFCIHADTATFLTLLVCSASTS